MAKMRSKLKRHPKGKTWNKGQSATSNPEQMKHRLKAKSRFFQPNLSLQLNEQTSLTKDAIFKHEQRQLYKRSEMMVTTTVNDVAGSLRSFKLNADDDDNNNDEMMSESQQGTSKTGNTFASNYSACTNMSFKKLLVGFRTTSELHKEMLAILTALTEIIKERGGTESSTEYFILLMEQIEASTEENDIMAGISLLAMGIKTVPAAVLRKCFDGTAQTLLRCLQRFAESSKQSVIKSIIVCFSVLLRAQDYTFWTYSSTWKYIDTILSFSLHSKPKIRKAAQHAIVSIIQGSSFMLPPKPKIIETDGTATADIGLPQPKKAAHHPAGNRVARFCLQQFTPDMLLNAQTTVLHTLTLLKDTLSGFQLEDIRSVCESLLSIMTATNVLVRTNCLQALHALFLSRTSNINANLCGKLLAAIHEYQPDRSDIRQTLAWLTVLKEGYIHLASLELHLCMAALPRLVEVCVNNLWLSDYVELIVGVANCMKELLHECVQPACATPEVANQNSVAISRIIALMGRMLNAPFGDVTKYVILTFAIMFEVCGAHFSAELAEAVATIGQHYDTQSSLRIQIEHAIVAAIKSMGPEVILNAISLTNARGEVVLEKSWLLPLLRDGITGATFRLFKEVILPLALDCNTKWHQFAEEKQIALAHTHELLCCQLWGLFPGFCRQPTDPENFSIIAPTLGNALDNNPEFRAPIFDGFVELMSNNNNDNNNEFSLSEINAVLARYAKNFLPRLFNIYTQKPNGTYEADLRKKCLEVIKLYFLTTSDDILKELYESAKLQLSNATPGSFEYDAIFDITAALVIVQSCETINNFFISFIVPVLKNEKSKFIAKDEQKFKKQQRKTYELLRDILTSEAASCQKFGRKNVTELQKVLLDACTTSCTVCRAARLRCLKILIEQRKTLTINDKIVMKTIPEAVLTFKEFSTRKENISHEIIILIANLYKDADKLNDFVDILTSGFSGDESLVTNTIFAFRALLQQHGKDLTLTTLEFVLDQISVFLVQKSRPKAEASVVFLITFIKLMPSPLIANHLEVIMKSLSAMAKDTKRYCRIQIGYLLKKLCKCFTAEELIKFVPGDDEVTHRRLKKIRKQLRRDTRKRLNEERSDGDDESDDEFVTGLKKKSVTIDDILKDSESDLSVSMDEDDRRVVAKKKARKTKTTPELYIREDPDDIVDLADIKSISKVLTSRPIDSIENTSVKPKNKDTNRGFKTAPDGRLIISDKALRDNDGDDTDASSASNADITKKPARPGLEDNSSDEEANNKPDAAATRKRRAADAFSMRSGTTASRYTTTTTKGIHRAVGNASVAAVSMKSGYTAKTNKSTAYAGSEYSAKKAKGDVKKKGKLDPYAYIPLSRNILNKRKRVKNTKVFKKMLTTGAGKKGPLKGVKNKLQKRYKK